jgi:DnaJ-class molecular chaperone
VNIGERKMDKFRTGNVVKLPDGGIVIIVGYRTVKNSYREDYRVVDWIPFDFEHSSGATRELTYTNKNKMCYTCLNDGSYPSECTHCNGTGRYDVIVEGMDKAEILSSTIKGYIIDRLTKNFDW